LVLVVGADGCGGEEETERDVIADVFCGIPATAGIEAEEFAKRPARGRKTGFAGSDWGEDPFWAGSTTGIAPTEGCVTGTRAGFEEATGFEKEATGGLEEVAGKAADVAPPGGCEAATADESGTDRAGGA